MNILIFPKSNKCCGKISTIFQYIPLFLFRKIKVMTYRLKRIFHFILLIALILSGLYIFGYYLFANDINQLRTLPVSFLVVVIFYIAIQLIKRFFQKEVPWYNWLYYIGLLAVVSSLPALSLQDDWLFLITRFGSLFLLIPPIIDLIKLIKQKK